MTEGAFLAGLAIIGVIVLGCIVAVAFWSR